MRILLTAARAASGCRGRFKLVDREARRCELLAGFYVDLHEVTLVLHAWRHATLQRMCMRSSRRQQAITESTKLCARRTVSADDFDCRAARYLTTRALN